MHRHTGACTQRASPLGWLQLLSICFKLSKTLANASPLPLQVPSPGQADAALQRLAQQCVDDAQASQTINNLVAPGDTGASILSSSQARFSRTAFANTLTLFLRTHLCKGGRFEHHAYATAETVRNTVPQLTEGQRSKEWGIHAPHLMKLARQCHVAGDVPRALRNWFSVLVTILEECDGGRVVHNLLAARCAQRMHTSQV